MRRQLWLASCIAVFGLASVASAWTLSNGQVTVTGEGNARFCVDICWLDGVETAPSPSNPPTGTGQENDDPEFFDPNDPFGGEGSGGYPVNVVPAVGSIAGPVTGPAGGMKCQRWCFDFIYIDKDLLPGNESLTFFIKFNGTTNSSGPYSADVG